MEDSNSKDKKDIKDGERYFLDGDNEETLMKIKNTH